MIPCFCLGYLLLFAFLGPHRVASLFPKPFFFGLVLLPLLLGMVAPWLKAVRRSADGMVRLLDRRRSHLLALPIGFLGLGLLFFVKFPLHEFKSVILFDDFTSLYGAALRGIRILREGSLFGWEDRLLGGYYTVSDLNFNLAPFLLPFLVFGAAGGYHLMILSATLLFPYLLYRIACLVFEERSDRIFVFFLAVLFTAGFFRNILFLGMVDNLIGLDLLLLTVLSFERALKRGRFGLFLSVLALLLCAVAHLGYFIYAVAWLFLRSLLGKGRWVSLSQALLIATMSGVLLLPYLVYFLEFRSFFILDALRFSPSPPQTAPPVLTRSLGTVWSALLTWRWLESGFEGLKGSNYLATSLLCLPLFLYLFFTSKRSRGFIVLLGLVLVVFSLKFPGNLALKRVYFLFPILLSLILADWLGIWLRRGNLGAFLLMVPILSVSLGAPSPHPIPHVASLKSLYPRLYETLVRQKEGWILLESQALWIRTDSGRRPKESLKPHAHPEILLALETGGHLFASSKDGYHFSIYRGNALMSGILQGKPISEYPPAEMRALLEKWGIHFIAVWSRSARDYFRTLKGTRLLWSEEPWHLFEFKEGDGKRILVQKGKATFLREGYTQKRISLNGVPQGTRVLLRMNSFPGWSGRFQGRELPLINQEGQLAFESPTSGEGVVELRFKTYGPLYGLSAAVLLGLFLASFRRGRR